MTRDAGLWYWDWLYRYRLARRGIGRALLFAAALSVTTPIAAIAQDGERSLSLIDIHQGSGLSDLVRFISDGGYQLAIGDGTDKPAHSSPSARRTRATWRDFSLEWLLQLDDSSGILFGLSTGEHGGITGYGPDGDAGRHQAMTSTPERDDAVADAGHDAVGTSAANPHALGDYSSSNVKDSVESPARSRPVDRTSRHFEVCS